MDEFPIEILFESWGILLVAHSLCPKKPLDEENDSSSHKQTGVKLLRALYEVASKFVTNRNVLHSSALSINETQRIYHWITSRFGDKTPKINHHLRDLASTVSPINHPVIQQACNLTSAKWKIHGFLFQNRKKSKCERFPKLYDLDPVSPPKMPITVIGLSHFYYWISINLHLPRLHPGWGYFQHPRNPHTWRNAKTVGGEMLSVEAVKRQGLNSGVRNWARKLEQENLPKMFTPKDPDPSLVKDWGFQSQP